MYKREPAYREQTKFLWFPKTIDGKTKWLILGKWVEISRWEKQINWFNLLAGYEYRWCEWEPYKWIEK